MRNFVLTLRLFLGISLLTVPTVTMASGADINEIAINLVFAFWPLWIIVGVLVLVVAGFTLVIANDESRLQKARSTIVAVVIGGIVTTIIFVLGATGFVGIMYNALPGIGLLNFGGYSVNPISIQAAGIADWLTVISVMLGILFIIVAALRAVSSFGDEAKYESARNALIQAVFGFIVIAGAYVFRTVFYDVKTPNALIGLVVDKILIVLGIITTIAMAILIYAGFRMIISLGDDTQYEAAKSLAIRVLVGLLVILLSYALVIIIANIF